MDCHPRLRLLVTLLPALLLVGCGGGEPEARLTEVSAQAVSPVERPVARPTETRVRRPAPEPTREPPVPPALTAPVPPETEKLLDAYAHYWELYAEALLLLDGSRLPEVMTGPRLERALLEVERLRRSGRAVQIVVVGAPLVAAIAPGEATIVDHYENASYLIDPQTREAVADRGDPETIRTIVSLVRETDGWKVHESHRQETP